MFIDTSAILSILFNEEDKEEIATAISEANKRYTSATVLWECVVSSMNRKVMTKEQALKRVMDFLEMSNISIIPIDKQIGLEAIEAYDKFGKNRHKADLNFADCFSYACAKKYRMPLLFKGNDFIHTDIDKVI